MTLCVICYRPNINKKSMAFPVWKNKKIEHKIKKTLQHSSQYSMKKYLNCDDIYTSFPFHKHTQILVRVHWRFMITCKLQCCYAFFVEISTLFIDFKYLSKRIFNESKCRQPFRKCTNQIVLGKKIDDRINNNNEKKRELKRWK